jgi:hypothetical protein
MLHKHSTYFSSFIARSQTAFGLFVRNRKRVATSLVGGYLIAVALLIFVSSRFYQPVIPFAQAAGENLSAVISANKTTLQLGETLDLTIDLQNTDLESPIDKLSLDLQSTDTQLAIETSLDQTGVILAKNQTSIELSTVGPQATKKIVLTARLIKSNTPYIGAYFLIRYESNKKSHEQSTNRIFLGTNARSVGGKLITLKSNQTEYKLAELVKLTASISNLEGEIKGTLLTVQDTNVLKEYECTITVLAPCETEMKELKLGTYTSWFITENQEIYSNLISYQITTDTPEFKLSEDVRLVTPFNSISIAGNYPIILKDVINRNEKPITCRITLTKKDTDFSKNFDILSDSSRECSYWISTSELNGFGEYIIKVLGSTLEKTIIVTDNASPLPLDVTNVLLVQDQPVALSSKPVLSTILPTQNYTGSAELLLYSPLTRSLETIISNSTNPINFANGELATELAPKNFEEGGIFYTSLKIVEVNGTTTTTRFSSWKVINFGSNQANIPTLGIEIEDLNQLVVGGKPVVLLKGITDQSGNLISGRQCVLSLYEHGALQVKTISSTVTNGECRVVFDDTILTKTGTSLITFYSKDSVVSLPQSRVIEVDSGEIRTLGEVSLASLPASRTVANNLIIGPIKDKNENLVKKSTLILELAQEKNNWIKTEQITVENGFSTQFIPGSMLDSSMLYARILQGEEVLSEVEFAVSENIPLSLALPSSVTSGEQITIVMNNLVAEWLECTLTLKSIDELIVTVPVDLATKSCTIKTPLPKALSSSLSIKFEYGKQSVKQVISIIPNKVSNNFELFPQVRINKENQVELRMLSTPLTDAQGLEVTSSEMSLKLNGKDIVQKNGSSVASIPVTSSVIKNQDIKQLFGKRFLDIDIEGGVNARSRTLTDKLKLPLGSKELASEFTQVKLLQLNTSIPTFSTQLVKLQTTNCEAWLKQGTVFQKLEKIVIGNQCTIFIASSISGAAKLIVLDRGNEVLNSELEFTNEAPLVVWNVEKGITAQLLSLKNYQLTATIADSLKTYSFDAGNEQSIKLSQQGLADSLEYTVRLEAIDTDGYTHIFIKTVLGSQLK